MRALTGGGDDLVDGDPRPERLTPELLDLVPPTLGGRGNYGPHAGDGPHDGAAPVGRIAAEWSH